MKHLLIKVLVAAGIGLAIDCWGEPLVPLPEELAITRSVVTQERDELEVTPSVSYFRAADGRSVTPSLETEYGFTDEFELDAEVPYEFVQPHDGRSANGISDIEIDARYGLIDSRNHPFAVTLGLAAELPTGNRLRNLGEGRLSLEPFFTASQRLGRFAVEFNGGWQRAVSNAGTDPRNEFEYNVALLYPIHNWFLVLEGDGTSTSEQTKYYITPEVVWKAAKKIQCFFAVPIGITRAAGDFGIVVGVTIEIENVLQRGADND